MKHSGHKQSRMFSGAARRIWAWISPNFPTLLFLLAGLAGEMVLLGRTRDSIYAAGGLLPWFVRVWLVWFWLTSSWIVWTVSLWFASRTQSWPAWARILTRATAMILGVALMVIYLASWGLY